MRPWCWIVVGLASLVVLPPLEVTAPLAGTVQEVSEAQVTLQPEGGAEALSIALDIGPEADWQPLPSVARGDVVEQGATLAATDSERAYVVMMRRFLPVGLLGLVAASLIAAFMSTIDTHVNLAASFFVNDVYRRFLVPSAETRHYLVVARLTCVFVLLVGGVLAWYADSVRKLFEFFLAFLGGVGPVYVMRWLWWRIRASTEIAAMTASAVTSTWITFAEGVDWSFLGPLAQAGGGISSEGRLVVVVSVSLACAFAALALAPRPDPARLVPFYELVRPLGAWGPVRALAKHVDTPREWAPALWGSLSALVLTYGALFAIGFAILGRRNDAVVATVATILGAIGVRAALRRLPPGPRAEHPS